MSVSNNQHIPVASNVSIDQIQANSLNKSSNNPMKAASTIGKGQVRQSIILSPSSFLIKGLLGSLFRLLGLSKNSEHLPLEKGQSLLTTAETLEKVAVGIAQNNLSKAFLEGSGGGNSTNSTTPPPEKTEQTQTTRRGHFDRSTIVPGSKEDIIPGREGLAAEQEASKASTASAESPNQDGVGQTQKKNKGLRVRFADEVTVSEKTTEAPNQEGVKKKKSVRFADEVTVSEKTTEASNQERTGRAQGRSTGNAHAAEGTSNAWNLRSVQEYHKNELTTYKKDCLELFDRNIANPSPETREERRQLEAKLDGTIAATLKNIGAQFRMGGGGALDVMKDTLTSAKEDMETLVAVSLNKADQEEVVVGVRIDPREPPVKTVSMFAEDKIKEAKQYERKCMEWFDKKVAFYGAYHHLNASQAEQANVKVVEMRQNLTKAFAALEKQATSYVNNALEDLPSNSPISQKAAYDADVLLDRFFYEPADQMLAQLEMHLRVMDEQFRARYNNMS